MMIRKKMGIEFSTSKHAEKYSSEQNLETFVLLWLDEQVDSNEENCHAQKQLRTVINQFKTFTDPIQCEQYISTRSKDDRIILIISGRLGPTIVPRIHHLYEIISIYIYCMNKQINEQWAKAFPKVLII